MAKTSVKRDLYQTVTDQILASLESGAAPWVRPWKVNGNNGLPVNRFTGNAYRGINVLTLWLAQTQKGYGSNRWMGISQANRLGWKVRKGERGTICVFFKALQVEDKATGEEKEVACMRHSFVYNLEQLEGDGVQKELEPKPEAEPKPLTFDRCIDLLAAIPAKIEHGGGEAFFAPMLDKVQLPKPEAFDSEAHYWATLWHEMSHWTGHESRLNRDLGNRFGSAAYAVEELVAEISAAYLCGALEIPGELRHAGYIHSWLKVLREDKTAFFRAAAMAQKASDYLIGHKAKEVQS